MPELPEVEHLRRSLEEILPGRRISGVTLRRPDIVTGPRRQRNLLLGGVVRRLLRHGKQLAIIADDGRALCVHLGMSGQMIAAPRGARLKRNDHIHVEWKLSPAPAEPLSDDWVAGRLIFRDPRRFGGLWTFDSLESLVAQRWRELGPDALTITADRLAPRLAGSQRPIKAALLDQSVLAGVGNIYADEALFLARVSPLRSADAVKDLEGLCSAVRETLEAGIAAGGSTLRDYVDARGEPGRRQLSHAVYARGGLACVRCGKGLSCGDVAQRTTVWCGRCQA